MDHDETVELELVKQTWAFLEGDEALYETLERPVHESRSHSKLNIREQELVHQSRSKPEYLPDYTIGERIGEGGMGIVYSAHQGSIDREIALKMIKGDATDHQQDLFLSEAVASGNLDHPNIVPVHDLGANENGELFYVMKKVQGTPWDKVIAERTRLENLDILLDVCDGVAYAHSRGVIHRDLKPENVMLGDFGEVYVMDWGLAVSVVPQGKAQPLTEQLAAVGTPGYLAPEMAEGNVKLIGIASDVYLLGAILFEIVTGTMPHDGEDVYDCIRNALKNVIVEVDQKGELYEIAMKAMATDPKERYVSVLVFQQAIREYIEHYESIRLTNDAFELLNDAGDNYEAYSNAIFAFREALKIWEANHRAQEGLSRTQLMYARIAFRRGDLELADSLLDSGEPDHEDLHDHIQSAINEREDQKRKLSDMQSELNSAGKVQTDILTKRAVRIDPFDLDVLYRPAGDIGCGYHEFFPIGRHRMVAVIAVADEPGIAASLDVVALRTMFRMVLPELNDNPQMLIQKINHEFSNRNVTSGLHVSAVVCVFDTREDIKFSVICVGSAYALLFNRDTGTIREYKSNIPPLGFAKRKVFNRRVAFETGEFTSGDILTVVSSGLASLCNPAGVPIGSEYIKDVLLKEHSRPLNKLLRDMGRTINRYRAGGDQDEDIMVAMVKYAGEKHFETPDGLSWTARQGTWSLSNDQILGWSDHEGYLICSQPHPDNFRLRVTMQATQGYHLSIWFAGSANQVEFDGYFVGVRRKNADLQRKGKVMVKTDQFRLRRNNDYVITVERINQDVKVTVEGNKEQTMLVYSDPEPLQGPDNRTWGFYVWNGRMAIKEWSIEELL